MRNNDPKQLIKQGDTTYTFAMNKFGVPGARFLVEGKTGDRRCNDSTARLSGAAIRAKAQPLAAEISSVASVVPLAFFF